MAVFHVVWLRFRPHINEERIAEHIEALESLPARIEAISDFSIGRNFTDRADGFTHGLIVRLADRDGLQQYLEHEHHVRVATSLRNDAELRVMDYEA